MANFSNIFKADPTVSDPAVAAASGITRDDNGTLHLKHTAASNKLAAISAMAWGPVLDGALIPSVEYTPIVKQGGQMYKYAAGAQMVQPQLASGQLGMELLAMALVLAAMLGDLQANLTILKIMLAAQQGDLQAAQVAKLLQAIVQQMKGSRKARLGAKLDYIKLSIGECPEGQEVVYFKKGGEICKVCAGKKMQNGGKSDPIKDFKKKKDITKQTYLRNPYTRGKSAKEIAEMQRRNRQEAGAGKGENDANVAPWNYKKKKMK